MPPSFWSLGDLIASHGQSHFKALLVRCAAALILSFGLVVILTKIALVLRGSLGMRRALRQRHCPTSLIKRHAEKISIPATGGIWMLCAQGAIFWLLMDRKDLGSWLLMLISSTFAGLGVWDDFAKVRRKYRSKSSPPLPPGDVSAKAKFFIQLLLSLALLIPLTSERFNETSEGVWKGKNGVERPRQKLPESGQEVARDQKDGENLSSIYSKFFLPGSKGPILRTEGWQYPLALLFFAFVVVGSSNAVNLTDGLDGLAGGCSFFIALALAIGALCSADESVSMRYHLPFLAHAGQVAIYLSGTVGGLTAFLLFNRHPAQIFMGDVGSLSLGASLGFAAILIRQEWLLACSSIVLIAETLSVIAQVTSFRFRRGKRLFLCTPLHHHFECLNWTERKIVYCFWLTTCLFTAIGLSLLLVPRV